VKTKVNTRKNSRNIVSVRLLKIILSFFNNLLFVSPPIRGVFSKITLLSVRRGGVRLFAKKLKRRFVYYSTSTLLSLSEIFFKITTNPHPPCPTALDSLRSQGAILKIFFLFFCYFSFCF